MEENTRAMEDLKVTADRYLPAVAFAEAEQPIEAGYVAKLAKAQGYNIRHWGNSQPSVIVLVFVDKSERDKFVKQNTAHGERSTRKEL